MASAELDSTDELNREMAAALQGLGGGDDGGDDDAYIDDEDLDGMFEVAEATEFVVAEVDETAAVGVVQEAHMPLRMEPIGTSTLSFGVYTMIGARDTMEDADTTLPNLDGSGADGQPPWHAFFGVYDGHGGASCSAFLKDHLHQHVMESAAFGSGDVEAAMVDGFAATEAAWHAHNGARADGQEAQNDGSTAAVVHIRDTRLVAANVGDSEIVLARDGEAVVLSEIHNPSKNPEEIARVEAAGGKVIGGKRVAHPALGGSMFSIGVSRAFGDHHFKQDEFTGGKPSGLVAEPFVRAIDLADEDQFVIIACDGLWDVMAYQDAVDFVIRRINNNVDHFQACKDLGDRAFALGSTDNISVVVVFFDP